MSDKEAFHSQTIDFFRTNDLTRQPSLPIELERAAQSTEGVLPCYEMLARIRNVLTNPIAAIADIEQAVENDIALASRILAEAPSAPGVRAALRSVGIERVRALAANADAHDAFPSQDVVATLLWKHSAAVANLARLIALHLHDYDAQVAFACGLLHDVGGFLLHQAFPERYVRLFEHAVNAGWQFEDLERIAFGADHSEAGTAFATKLGIGHTIASVIRIHHQVGQLSNHAASPELQGLAAIVAVADDLVHRHLKVNGTILKTGTVRATEASRMLRLKDAHIVNIWPEFCRQYNEVSIMLCPPSA